MHEHFHGGCHAERPEHERVHVQIQFNAFQPENHGCFQRRNDNFCHRPNNHLPDIVINFGGGEPPCGPAFERHIPGPPRFYPVPQQNGGGYSFGYERPEGPPPGRFGRRPDYGNPDYDNGGERPPYYGDDNTAYPVPEDRPQPQYDQRPRPAASAAPDLSETSYGDDGQATPDRSFGYGGDNCAKAGDKPAPGAAPKDGATGPDFYDGRRNGEGDITPPASGDAAPPTGDITPAPAGDNTPPPTGDLIPAAGDAPPPGSDMPVTGPAPAAFDAPRAFDTPGADRSTADQIGDILDQQTLMNVRTKSPLEEPYQNPQPTGLEPEARITDEPPAAPPSGTEPEARVDAPKVAPVYDSKPGNDKPAADNTEGVLPDIYGMPDMGQI